MIFLAEPELIYECPWPSSSFNVFGEDRNVIHTELAEYLRDNFICRFGRTESKRVKKNLILVGSSKLGKTDFIRSLGTHMYHGGEVNYKNWDKSAKFIVFDDIEPLSITQWKQFLGSQKEFTLNDKYRKKLSVIWGKPTVILTNTYPTRHYWGQHYAQTS
jgi:hypothetical protein